MLTGIYSTSAINIQTTSIVLSRCNVASINISSAANADILIEEIISRGNIEGNAQSNTNFIFKKNILYGSALNLGTGGVSFSNNIFFNLIGGEGGIVTSNCLFENNIFLRNTTTGPTMFGYNNIFTNNLFVLSSDYATTSNPVFTGNIFEEPLANIFTNYTSGSAWSKTQNFRLKAGCNGIGLGTDGTDVGIYGSTAPFKDGGLPFNPHFKSVSIPNSTSADGKLNINITVQAQQN
jgi:hypothetical protein